MQTPMIDSKNLNATQALKDVIAKHIADLQDRVRRAALSGFARNLFLVFVDYRSCRSVGNRDVIIAI